MTATCRQSLGHVRLVHSHRDMPPCCRPSHQSPPLLFCGGDGVESPRFQKLDIATWQKSVPSLSTNLCPCCFVAWMVLKSLAFKNRVSHQSPPLLLFFARIVLKVLAFKKCFPLSYSERKFWKGAQEKHFCQKGLPRRQMLKLNKIRKSYQKKVFT